MSDRFNFSLSRFRAELVMNQKQTHGESSTSSTSWNELGEKKSSRTAPRARTGFSARRRSPAGRAGSQGEAAASGSDASDRSGRQQANDGRGRAPCGIGYGVAGPERTQEKRPEHVRWIQNCSNRAMSASRSQSIGVMARVPQSAPFGAPATTGADAQRNRGTRYRGGPRKKHAQAPQRRPAPTTRRLKPTATRATQRDRLRGDGGPTPIRGAVRGDSRQQRPASESTKTRADWRLQSTA